MNPFSTAAHWHLGHCPETHFREIVEAHFQSGYVISTPELFILARRIKVDWQEARILDPWQYHPEGDAWHIWLFAGSLPAIPAIIPYRLPYVTFHRGDRLSIHGMDTLLRCLSRQ